MGQFAKDWTSLKQIISQKDNALERAAAQIATQTQQIAQLQKQVASIQGQFDAADQKAAAELRQVIADGVGPVPPGAGKATPEMTTFTK